MAANNTPTSRQLVRVARWAWVAIPLAWGVWQTARTSLALFQ
jgi:hypothetical protein